MSVFYCVSPQADETEEGSGPPDADRVLFALEALSGAKWLLMLAWQSLDGSRTLQLELQEAKRGHESIAGLCEALGRRQFPTPPNSLPPPDKAG